MIISFLRLMGELSFIIINLVYKKVWKQKLSQFLRGHSDLLFSKQSKTKRLFIYYQGCYQLILFQSTSQLVLSVAV